jgi:Na+-driven multidrug efflux pump
MLPLGFSIGVTTRVGNELGAGNGKTAARAAKVAITFVVCVQLCFSLVLFSLRYLKQEINFQHFLKFDSFY